MNELELLKDNVLNLASDHKANCTDPECNISMVLVAVLLEKA